jgi:hypothetical protein
MSIVEYKMTEKTFHIDVTRDVRSYKRHRRKTKFFLKKRINVHETKSTLGPDIFNCSLRIIWLVMLNSQHFFNSKENNFRDPFITQLSVKTQKGSCFTICCGGCFQFHV